MNEAKSTRRSGCGGATAPRAAGLAGLSLLSSAWAQDNFEIQVYASETQAPRSMMVELHSNYTVDGQRRTDDGTFPSQHALHETLELTYGFNSWFETGAYLFTSVQPGAGFEWAGTHLRPRVRVPEEWHWPVGVSLSSEIGYFRPSFTADTWSFELRPILDRQWGRFYAAVNLAMEKSLHGPNSSAGFEFAPSAKASYQLFKPVALGAEYYTSLGELTHWSDWRHQQHQIYPVLDLDLSPKWEINFGVGFGLTPATDDLVVKLILGRRF